MNSTRKLRRLYFGNLPLHLGLTESLFQDMLWIEMKNRGLCNNANERKKGSKYECLFFYSVMFVVCLRASFVRVVCQR